MLDVLPFFYKGNNFCGFLFALLFSCQAPSERGLKVKKTPKGNKLFPFRVYAF